MNKIVFKKNIRGYIEEEWATIIKRAGSITLTDEEFKIWSLETKFEILLDYLESN